MNGFTSRIGIFLAVMSIIATQNGPCMAGLLPVGNSVVANGNNFNYSYGVTLTSNSTMQTGDYFTIYDFPGLVAGSNTQPAGFTFSSALVGPTPGGTFPTDSATLANATWTYAGEISLVGQLNLGNFGVQSQFGPSTTTGQFTSLTHRQSDGREDSNITDTQVPVPGVPGVPEPASLALVGIGLPLVGLFRYLRKRRE